MAKRFKTGLVLGKFMPVHRGHQFLIDTAIENCEHVHVMVCSIEGEPIDGMIRFIWMKQLYKGVEGITIHWCTDENPQYEHECETLDEFYAYWVRSVYKRVDKLDAVFTSEDYGDDFARYLDVEHVCVDKDRKTFPVSGTKVRDNAFDVWDYVLDHTKYIFNKKVVIMGPESTGKSTLVKRLAEYFGTTFTEEYGREYCEKRGGTENFTIEDFENIADEHLYRHNRDVFNANKVHFVDTEALVTKVFAEMYLGDDVKSEPIENNIQLQKFDLVLLLDVDVPWVDDGTRDFPDPKMRKKHFKRLKNILNEYGVKYHVIKGDYEDRFIKTRDIVNDLLKTA